jgi:hypothetical protein
MGGRDGGVIDSVNNIYGYRHAEWIVGNGGRTFGNDGIGACIASRTID